MLYKVTLSGSLGYVYVLFEHKSYFSSVVGAFFIVIPIRGKVDSQEIGVKVTIITP